MELQPFGPVEQAIQKPASLELPKPKTLKYFLGGVLATLAALAVGWTIAFYIKREKDKKQEKKTIPTGSTSLS